MVAEVRSSSRRLLISVERRLSVHHGCQSSALMSASTERFGLALDGAATEGGERRLTWLT